MSSPQHFAVRFEEAHLAAVLQRAEADPVRLLRDRIPDRDIRNVDRHFLGEDAAGLVLHRVRPRVPLYLVHARYHEFLRAHGARDFAALALVAARDDHHVVALLDLAHGPGPYSTSG